MECRGGGELDVVVFYKSQFVTLKMQKHMRIIKSIQNSIYEIRGERVMLDRDLATLYEIDVKVLNQAVKRHAKRFPKDFMFQLTNEEFEQLKFQIKVLETGDSLRSQIVTLKNGRG